MHNDFTGLAFIQLIMALLLGVSIMYLSFGYLHKKVFVKHAIEKRNLAFGIFASAVLFSIAYLLQGVMAPIISITSIFNGKLTGFDLYFKTFSYAGLFVLIGITLAGLINLSAVFLFTTITKNIDEFQEIKNDNQSVALITGVIIIGIAMLTKDSMILFMETLIPYPELPSVL